MFFKFSENLTIRLEIIRELLSLEKPVLGILLSRMSLPLVFHPVFNLFRDKGI